MPATKRSVTCPQKHCLLRTRRRASAGVVDSTALFAAVTGVRSSSSRVDPILRRLDADVIADTVGRIKPEVRSDLVCSS